MTKPAWATDLPPSDGTRRTGRARLSKPDNQKPDGRGRTEGSQRTQFKKGHSRFGGREARADVWEMLTRAVEIAQERAQQGHRDAMPCDTADELVAALIERVRRTDPEKALRVNLYVTVAEDIGGTTTAFKKMVSQGKVTSKMLAESLIKNTRKYVAQLREMPRTIGDVWTVVSNDVKNAIRGMNSEGSFTTKIASKLLKAWESLKKGADDFVDSLGGPDGLIQLLKNCGETALWLAGAFAAIKIVTMITNPAGAATVAVAALGVAFLALKNDFDVWRNGGQSEIDWGGWIQQMHRLADSFGMTGDGVDKVGKSLKDLKGFSLSDWSIEKEITSIGNMFRQLSNIVNDTAMTIRAGLSGNYEAAKYYADRVVQPDRYYDASGKNLDPTGQGLLVAPADQYYRDQLDGKQPPVVPQNAPTTREGWEGDYVPPQNMPGVNSSTNTVNNSPTYNVTVNAQTNASAQDIGSEVTRQIQAKQPGNAMAEQILKNTGAN